VYVEIPMENEDQRVRPDFSPEHLRKLALESVNPKRVRELLGDAPERILAQRLRGLREELGMTQKQLAERMTRRGFSIRQTTIAKIEAGQRPVRVNEAVALANILAVELGDLVDDPVASGEAAELSAEHRRLLREVFELEAQVNSLRATRASTDLQLMDAHDRLRQLHREEFDVSRNLRVAQQKARGLKPIPRDEEEG